MPKPNLSKRSLGLRSLLRVTGCNKLFTKNDPDSIHELICSRNWKELRNQLAEADHEQAKDTAYVQTTDEPNSTALHLACERNPPLDIIQRMADIYPDALVQLNNVDQTPLHLAVSFGASLAVIDFLLEQNPAAASMQDANGKTPLHLSCENRCNDNSCHPVSPGYELVKKNMLCVVKSLVEVSQRSINVEDESGMSPIELAVCNGADIKVVKFLQKSSQRIWKAEKSDKKAGLTRCVPGNAISSEADTKALQYSEKCTSEQIARLRCSILAKIPYENSCGSECEDNRSSSSSTAWCMVRSSFSLAA